MRGGDVTSGDAVEVWARRKGAAQDECLGRLPLEDLGGVLTRMATRHGRNGPEGPMTQFIVAAAADRLADALLAGFFPQGADELVPRVLSGLVGHERFVEDVLGLSVHHMRRRWPYAPDWYADLLDYVLRPARHERNHQEVAAHRPIWFHLRLGEALQQVASHQIRASQDPRRYQLADIVQWLWPHHPAVRSAQRHEHRVGREFWAPQFEALLANYGLRPRGETSSRLAAWTFHALITMEAHQRIVDPELPEEARRLGARGSLSAEAALIHIAGASETLDGRPLTTEELYARRPGGR